MLVPGRELRSNSITQGPRCDCSVLIHLSLVLDVHILETGIIEEMIKLVVRLHLIRVIVAFINERRVQQLPWILYLPFRRPWNCRNF